MRGLIFLKLLILLCFTTCLSCEDDDTVDKKQEVVDEFYGEPFDKVPSPDEVIMYEANERVFAANASFSAITQRLDAISDLGVNVLWLMPINEQGTEKAFGSPYCVKDYTSTNPEYGTLAELRTLVEEAHKREMAVIIDWVANHTAWDHSWMKDHPEWYTQDENGNPMPPEGTNWSDVVDLDFNNHAMRAEMIESMKYWVREANIDGFRCDAADWVPVDFWRDAIYQLRKLQEGRTLIMLAEGTEPKNLQAGFDMDYAWNFCDVLEGVFNNSQSTANLFQSHFNELEQIPAGKQKLRHNTNHDRAMEHSPVTKYQSAEGALAAYVVSTTMGGVPLMYSSQEVAYPNAVDFFNYVAVDWSSNPELLNDYQALMSIYQQYDAFKNGVLEPFENDDVLCFTRTYNLQQVLVIVNVRNNVSAIEMPDDWSGDQWINAFTKENVNVTQTINLEPFQYLILVKE
ncbi:alpha-glucosidase C-terminal domain-containing protein [Carboxylicivirga sp. A043]|uniref:alpha-amylase family glycosyl hydrolase n=1 Tax=Carboxylicivirga litoralis TaxID=2816963 RepID=UPI0021CB7CA0|nr:alpha-amylase family glycosyl hydrolase [Carboxylicivirga sp. A043]MCU4155652.1 alpha-glucosidase C-terminal domain-containing protein [Carboxylicivirga sp. A043]